MRTLQPAGPHRRGRPGPGPGQAVLYGTTALFLERLGLDSLDELPPLAEFVPGPEVMDALEQRPPATAIASTPGRRRRRGAGAGGRRAPGERRPGDRRTDRRPAPRPSVPADPRTCRRRPRGHDRRDRDDGRPGERLQKVLAQAGIGSRRACEELIAAGRVTVNGEVADLGRRVEPDTDASTVDGVAVAVPPGLVYYLLNKPAGVVTTAADPQGRPTVIDLVPNEPRVFPGRPPRRRHRGAAAAHQRRGPRPPPDPSPASGSRRSTWSWSTALPTPGALRRLREGVELEDGLTAPARVSRSGPDGLRITIHEGRNRQVRRMCEAVGHPVATSGADPDRADADRHAGAGAVAGADARTRSGRWSRPRPEPAERPDRPA